MVNPGHDDGWSCCSLPLVEDLRPWGRRWRPTSVLQLWMSHGGMECGVSCTPERMRASSGGFGRQLTDGQHDQSCQQCLVDGGDHRVRRGWHGGYETAGMGGSGVLYICLVCQSLKLVGTMCMRPGGNKTSQSRGQGSAWVVLATSKPRASTRTSVPRYQPSGTRWDGKVCARHAAAVRS